MSYVQSDNDVLAHLEPGGDPSGVPRRGRVLIGAVAAVVLTLVAVTVAVLALGRDQTGAAADPFAGPTSVLRLHGVEVTVPAGWVGHSDCTFDQDVAEVTWGAHSCPGNVNVPEHPERFSTVVLTPSVAFSQTDTQEPGVHQLPDGRTEHVIPIDDRAVRLLVISADPHLADKVAGSVRLDDDADGCPLREGSERTHRDAGNSGRLVDEPVTGGSVCAYDGGWVVASHHLTDTDAAELAATANAAPAGFGPEGDFCPEGFDYPNSQAEPHWTVEFTGPSGDGRLWVYGQVCLPAAASNEDGRFSAVTDELVGLLSRLAPSPGSMPLAITYADGPVELCRQSHQGGDLVAVYSTTVEQVRRSRIGPGLTPAARPWADLLGAARAAWCESRTANGYAVYAAALLPDTTVTSVPFASTNDATDLGPDGPAVP